MTTQDAQAPFPRSRWNHRHPRVVAFVTFFLIYTGVAALLGATFGDPYTKMQANWLIGLASLEPFALLGGLLAVGFYGRCAYARDDHARNQSVFRGCVVGFLLVPLALLTRTLFDLATETEMRRSAWDLWQHQGLAMGMEMSFLYLAFATMYSLLLPEVAGAVAGYLVWRLVGPEPE